MKLAREVISVMAAYPGRQWVMRHLITFVCPGVRGVERVAMQQQVRRVLLQLAETGVVEIHGPFKRGGQGRYVWLNTRKEIENV